MAYDKTIVDEARQASPAACLRDIYGNAVTVSAGGRSISVKGVCRSDKKGDAWVSCNWQGGGIGDNLKLMEHVRGLGFEDAVIALTGKTPILGANVRPPPPMPINKNPRHNVATVKMKQIKIPAFIADFSQSRNYLLGRGISPEVIDRAHADGRLLATKDGVCFVGRDEHSAYRYIAHRYYTPQPVPNSKTGETRNKKDEVGSDKRYCFWLPPPQPDRPFSVWVVEGGTNALALADILAKNTSHFHNGGPQNALILTTGGVAMREWMKNPTTNPMIKEAVQANQRLVLVGEWESASTPEKLEKKVQDIADIRKRFLGDFEELFARPLEFIMPPKGMGDVADMAEAAMLEAKKAISARVASTLSVPADLDQQYPVGSAVVAARALCGSSLKPPAIPPRKITPIVSPGSLRPPSARMPKPTPTPVAATPATPSQPKLRSDAATPPRLAAFIPRQTMREYARMEPIPETTRVLRPPQPSLPAGKPVEPVRPPGVIPPRPLTPPSPITPKGDGVKPPLDTPMAPKPITPAAPVIQTQEQEAIMEHAHAVLSDEREALRKEEADTTRVADFLDFTLTDIPDTQFDDLGDGELFLLKITPHKPPTPTDAGGTAAPRRSWGFGRQ